MVESDGVVAVFLDYKRAFETINRSLLLRKLRDVYRITDQVYEWIEDYLNERYQTVRFNSSVSKEEEVIHGVPQGSKLGPLLFILYINDLPGVLRQCKIHMFADDTLIYMSGDNAQNVVNVINDELNVVCEWLCRNYLGINVQKTKCMVLGKRGFRDEAETRHTVVLMGSSLEWVKNYKYLGVIIDNSLSFKSHVEYINNKIAKKVNLLYKLRKTLSKTAKELLFKLLLVPHIRYCSTILSMISKRELASVQRNFNRGMRAVLKKKRSENIGSMLKELGYLSVENEIKRDVLTFIYRLEHNLLPVYLDCLVQKNSDVHNYSTRQARDFHLEPVHSSKGLKSLFGNGLVLYNMLPEEIKQAGSIRTYRDKVGIWLETKT